MVKKITVFVIAGLLLSMSYVPLTYAWHGGHAAGALVGGLLLGTVIGGALAQPHYVAPPPPVYVYRAPAPAYAYPSAPVEGPPGFWMEVPGQWVGGRWVPAHRAWVPVNP